MTTPQANWASSSPRAGTNLMKHAKRGEIHIQTCTRNGSTGIEVLAFDRGPGITSIERCLRDGYSTTATAGTGFGAIARLTDEFDIYSQKGARNLPGGQALFEREQWDYRQANYRARSRSSWRLGRCEFRRPGRPTAGTIGECGMRKAGRLFCWPTV